MRTATIWLAYLDWVTGSDADEARIMRGLFLATLAVGLARLHDPLARGGRRIAARRSARRRPPRATTAAA